MRDERWECRKSPIALEPVSAFKVGFGKRWQWSVQRVDIVPHGLHALRLVMLVV